MIRSVISDIIPPHTEIKALVSSIKKERSPVSVFISSLIYEGLKDIEKKAKEMGGNAVLGLRLEVEYFGWGRVLIVIYGTVAEVE